MVVACFAACQHDADVIGISEGRAKEKMLGAYAHTAVDSVLMQVTKIEYKLAKENGVATGYCRTSVAGECPLSDVTTPITWDAVIAPDKLSMIVTVTFENGETKQFSWWDGQLHEGDDEYVKSSGTKSEIDYQNTVYATLSNTEFAASKTTYYEHKGRVEFMGWKQKNYNRNGVAPADTNRVANELREGLEEHLDTIIWYMRYRSLTHTVGDAYLDTSIVGTDTTYIPRNIVFVNPNPNTRGNHMISYLVPDDTIHWVIEQINDRPMQRIKSEMKFARQESGESDGSYFFHIQMWKEEDYASNPEPPTSKDSLYTVENAVWALTSVASEKKFDVLMKGKLTQIVDNVTKEEEEAFTTISINGFSLADGEATVGEVKYKLKK